MCFYRLGRIENSLTSLKNFFTYLTGTAHLSFLSSTKTGLTTINGWVTGITGPVNKYIDKIRDWGLLDKDHKTTGTTLKVLDKVVNPLTSWLPSPLKVLTSNVLESKGLVTWTKGTATKLICRIPGIKDLCADSDSSTKSTK
ncbi:hypothetical protein [Tropheryma whipplei]|uniref:hypothetical protein n=1 Tax=Tropheryma whipplei TaxID=2039 RepID=UPI0002EB66F4|nr:hypothetical protein [Tropheryma whipplei]